MTRQAGHSRSLGHELSGLKIRVQILIPPIYQGDGCGRARDAPGLPTPPPARILPGTEHSLNRSRSPTAPQADAAGNPAPMNISETTDRDANGL